MPTHPFLPTLGMVLATLLIAGVPARGLQASESAPHAASAPSSPSAPSTATAAATASTAAPEAEAVSPAASAALAQLLGLPAAESAAAAAAAETRTTTTVREGETLDRIIRRTMGNTPFKDNLLQAAFVEANPRAYPNGSIQRLPVGTVINVPSAADLRRHLARVLGPERVAALAGAAAAAPAAAAPAGHAGHTGTAAPAASVPPPPPRPDHRGWVRFPG